VKILGEPWANEGCCVMDSASLTTASVDKTCRAHMNIFVLVRAITYATLFIGLVLVYVPGLLLGSASARTALFGVSQIVGMIITAAGAAIALWCIFTFAFVGHGTPAPFDPPRRLVIRGPYRFVRNPMYIGAILALLGAALFYMSWSILIYAIVVFFATHLFVVFYEETTLRRTFGSDYEMYCSRVKRWWPKTRNKMTEEG
jgi:protein-S-isoprenylcysteine O-methyltransferase Ste14